MSIVQHLVQTKKKNQKDPKVFNSTAINHLKARIPLSALSKNTTSEFRTHLFVKVSRPGDSEGNYFWSSSQAATCYYQSNHLNVEAIPLSTLPKNKTSELTGLLFTLFLFYAKRQAGKPVNTNFYTL